MQCSSNGVENGNFCWGKGMAVMKRNENDEWIFKTGWKKEDFDNETELILEALKKNGI